MPSGSSITIQQGAYICADEISVSGTFTYAGSAYSLSSSTTFHSADGSDPYIGLGMSYAFGKDNSISFNYISTEVDDADISGYGISWVRNF